VAAAQLRTGPEVPPAGRHVHSSPVQAVAGARLLFAIEIALPVLILVAVLVLTNLGAMPDGLDGFLSLRVTVKNVLLCSGFVAGWTVILRVCGLYDRRRVRRWGEEVSRLTVACSLSTGLALVFPLTSGGGFAFRHLAYLWAGSLGIALTLRAIRRVLARRHRARAPRRVIIVGTGPRALRLWSEFASDALNAYQLAGFVDVHREDAATEEIERQRLGTVADLERLLMQQAVDEVLIALPVKSHYEEFQHAIEVCERLGVRTRYHADMFTTSVAWARVEAGLHWIVTMNVAPDDYRLVFKRAFDVAGALAGLVVFSPVMAAAAVAIKLTSPGPVLFAQERIGRNKRPFRMLKFRTMVADAPALQATLETRNEADGPVFKIANDPRITGVGRFLRKTSVDELPQLINVLKGEMSLVGPRPLPARDVQRFTRGSDMRRFSVTPGLTCLWQISGRSQLGFNEWVQLDLKYIDRWSLREDLRILAKTIPAVLRGTGAS
jgi:exopolysaccharide biosynthesis polyprenyl glycosylphosphotransferase